MSNKGVGVTEAIGVQGLSDQGVGVNGSGATGVLGQGSGAGVEGLSTSPTGTGVFGSGKTGVSGRSSSTDGFGVFGENTSGHGVLGQSKTSRGVGGISESDIGVFGVSSTGIGVQGQSLGAGLAGNFIGNVVVTGVLTASDCALSGADCAEDFDVSGHQMVEPGTVMIINDEGGVMSSRKAYDRRVAGVVSGAGDYKPGITLDKRKSTGNRLPIALVGKAYCKVDAEYSPVEIGDLLTTSPTPGYAMKADDLLRAFGSVIGKALRSLDSGQV